MRGPCMHACMHARICIYASIHPCIWLAFSRETRKQRAMQKATPARGGVRARVRVGVRGRVRVRVRVI